MNQNLSGVWEANLEKSKLLGRAPKSISANIRHSDPDLSVNMTITMPDGAEHHLLFEGPTSGAEVMNVVNDQQWRSRMQWIGIELLIESWVVCPGESATFVTSGFFQTTASRSPWSTVTTTSKDRSPSWKGRATNESKVQTTSP